MNADGYLTTGQGVLSYNMFAYCGNNPVNRSDCTGNSWKDFKQWCSDKWDEFTTWCSNIISPNYNVPLYNQGNTNLCWAYSQTMVEDWEADRPRTKEEADSRAWRLGVSQNGGEAWDGPGWPTNLGEEIIVNDFYDVAWAVRKGPVYATYSNSTQIGHMVVVTGVNLKEKTIFINNPWGVQGELTYDEFIQGFPGEDEEVSNYVFVSMWDVES